VPVYIGDVEAGAVYLGDQPVKLYLGDVLVWPVDIEPPPPPVLMSIRPTTVGGVPFELELPVTTTVTFVGKGAQGGEGGRSYSNSSGLYGGAGGKGGTVAGSFTASAGSVLHGYVGARGLPAWQEPFSRGGEPGGACSQQNIYSQPYDGLGGPGGGLTSIYLDGAPRVIAAGGGGGGARGQGAAAGGKGGDGGSSTGEDGADGGFTGLFSNVRGRGGKGATIAAPGAGGAGGNLTNGPGDGFPGCDLAGGETFRLGAYGTGAFPHTCGGGGGPGVFGGGGGGNGTASSGSGGGGGGGGGASWADESVTVTENSRGTNTGDGSLVLTLLVPDGWDIPDGWEQVT
jgi:hypothetical protein